MVYWYSLRITKYSNSDFAHCLENGLLSSVFRLNSQIFSAGLSFREAERRLKETGPNIPIHTKFPRWWHLLWNALFHPFHIILIVLSVLSYITSDEPNGCIMLVLVFISVSLRFYQVLSSLLVQFFYRSYHIFLTCETWHLKVCICECQEYSSSKAAMKLSEFLSFPVKVQRCAGRTVQTELVVQVDQKNVVPGDIIIFEPGDLFPGDVRLLTSKNLVVRYRLKVLLIIETEISRFCSVNSVI